MNELIKAIGEENYKDVQNYLTECIKKDIYEAMKFGYFSCSDFMRDTVRDFLEQTIEKALTDIQPQIEQKIKGDILKGFSDQGDKHAN